MEVLAQHRSDATFLRVSGSLDRFSVARFEQQIGSLLDATDQPLVLDLGAAKHVSAAGVRAIYDLVVACREAGRPIRLTAPPAEVMASLTLVGLPRIVSVDVMGDGAGDGTK